MSPDRRLRIRRLLAATLVSGACLLLLVQYLRLVKPAFAREVHAACSGLRPSPDNPALGNIPPAEPVDFTAWDQDGNSVKLSDYRGKVVFVNFWASWCNVCQSEKPSLTTLTSERQGDDFVVLTLASDTDWNKIRQRVPADSGLPVLLDPPRGDDDIGTIARSWGIEKLPESFLVDRDGHIRHYFRSKRDWDSNIATTCINALIDDSV